MGCGISNRSKYQAEPLTRSDSLTEQSRKGSQWFHGVDGKLIKAFQKRVHEKKLVVIAEVPIECEESPEYKINNNIICA